MGIDFTNPTALILLVLAPAAVYAARSSLAAMSRKRAIASAALRVVMILSVVFALAGMRIRTESGDLALVFLVDVSSSVAQDGQATALDFINREIDRAGPRDYIGLVVFGREPAVELAPTRKELLGDRRLAEISSNPPRDYTNVAAALRLASALVPQSAVGRLVLISDGNENLESASSEALILRGDGTQVFTVPLDTVSEAGAGNGEVAVRDLTAPELAAEGEAFDLKATVDSTRDARATLRIFRNETLVAERDLRLTPSGENVFVLPQRIDRKGFYTYRAEVEALDSDVFVQNNTREAFTLVEGHPKTLYVYGDPAPSAGILRVLAEGRFDADIRGAGAVPNSLAGFQDYDLLIFDNVPASALTRGQMRMVQSFVRDLGGGFIMIGGDQSFGPGGYYKTPVEDTLPVSLDVRNKRHFPSLALALVIDRSGSMAGEKLELAAEAAAAAVDLLSERDSVGVISFDSAANPVVEMTSARDKRRIISQIFAIRAGGGTNMYPGLQMAHEWLAANDAQIKHVIALSDGQSSEGDFAGISRKMRDSGMTLTTVAVGDDADLVLMRRLAAGGGGRFYATDRPENLPTIFTREAFLASRSTIIEEPFVPKPVRPTQAVAGIDWNAAPPLSGYVGTAEREDSGTPAITSLISHKDDPVYASWQYGLGRAAAFTSDAKPRWSAAWLSWPGFGQFWTQALRDVLRRGGAGNLLPRVNITAGRGHVSVEAISLEGNYINNLRLAAHIVGPDLAASDVRLEQTAAGRYEAEFAAVMRGPYLVSLTQEGGEPGPVTGSVNSYSPEFSIASRDSGLLERLSEATGGRFLASHLAVPAPEGEAPESGLFARSATRTVPHEAWEVLLLVAILLLPFDVGARRVHVTREDLARAWQWVEWRVWPPRAQVEAETGPALAQLKASRARVHLNPAELSDRSAESTRNKRPSPFARETSRPTAAPGGDDDGSTSQVPDLSDGSTAPDGEKGPSLASRLLDAKKKRTD